jgi:hypothetical protein
MDMINEFIILRLKVYEICLIFHEVMPGDYEFIDLNDISISLDNDEGEINVRSNLHFDNAVHLSFGIEWLNMSDFAITNIAKKLKYLTKI